MMNKWKAKKSGGQRALPGGSPLDKAKKSGGQRALPDGSPLDKAKKSGGAAGFARWQSA
jgi:hypothetical protein